ncbi:MAG: DUF4271 domain-containing protein [Tunicatimonas sp.]
MGKLFVIVFLLTLSYPAKAQSDDKPYHLVEDLRLEWLTIDQHNRYVPFVASDRANPTIIGVRLDLEKYAGNQLRCCVPAQTSLLIEREILTSVDRPRCLIYSIDSLRNAYKQPVLLLTVYQPASKLSQVELQVVNNTSAPLAQPYPIFSRILSSEENFFVLGLVFILMFYATLINHYPKAFRNIYNLPRILALRSREEDLRTRLMSEPHTLFLIQHCLVVAFLFIVLVPDVDQWIPSGWFTSPGVGSYLGLWLLLSLIVLLTVWIKYLIVVLFGSLFKLKQFMYLHMFDFMRLSMMFWGVVFLLAICVHYNFAVRDDIYKHALTYLFIAFALARVLILYLRLFRNSTLKNMYLFSYICTAEIIPLSVGLELLIG